MVCVMASYFKEKQSKFSVIFSFKSESWNFELSSFIVGSEKTLSRLENKLRFLKINFREFHNSFYERISPITSLNAFIAQRRLYVFSMRKYIIRKVDINT